MNPEKRKIDAYKAASKKGKSAGKSKDTQNDDFTVDTGKKQPEAEKENKPRFQSRALSAGAPKIDAGLVKTTGKQGIKKAAKLIVLLGKENSAEILKHLSEEEIELVMREVSHIKKVDKVEGDFLLKEFDELVRKGKQPQGGKETAEAFLTDAFGEHVAKKMMGRIVPGEGDRPFSFLNELQYHQILSLIKGEKATVAGVILSFLEPELASKVFEALHPDVQKEVVQRIARMEKVHPDVIVQLEDLFREKIRRQGKIITEDIDGMNTLANILKYSDAGLETKILEDIEEINPELSKEIKELTLTLDIVEYLKADDFQAVLRDFSDTELSVILKGKSDEVKSFFFNNLSERRIKLIQDEMKYSGPMKKSDVEQATKEFVLYIKQLEDEGKIIIYKDKDQYI